MTSQENTNSINKENTNSQINDEASNINTGETMNSQNSEEVKTYEFGWSNYSEMTNGRFAMLGFAAIIIIELISNKSFLSWAGILP